MRVVMEIAVLAGLELHLPDTHHVVFEAHSLCDISHGVVGVVFAKGHQLLTEFVGKIDVFRFPVQHQNLLAVCIESLPRHRAWAGKAPTFAPILGYSAAERQSPDASKAFPESAAATAGSGAPRQRPLEMGEMEGSDGIG